MVAGKAGTDYRDSIKFFLSFFILPNVNISLSEAHLGVILLYQSHMCTCSSTDVIILLLHFKTCVGDNFYKFF